MENPLLKFRQRSIISEKPGYLSGLYWFCQITQDLTKIKKIPNILLYTLAGRKRAQNFNKNF